MSDSEYSDDLRERVDALEGTVGDLRDTVDGLRAEVRRLQQEGGVRTREASGTTESAAPVEPQASDTASETEGEASWVSTWSDRVLDVSGEDWLGRIGIGLLLFGLVFLFKYSIDQGWLGPPVRVGFGAVLGAGLLAAGLRTYADRRALSQVLLGGSFATFYTTVFAAQQLYGLLPYGYAFAAMVAVTVVAFALSVWQDGAVLSVIGTAGGLATPFLLVSDAGSVPGLVAYLCVVLAGATGVYLYRGWRSLLYTAVAGGWLGLFAAIFAAGEGGGGLWDAPRPDRFAMQAGLVGAWLLLGGVPVARAILRRRAPEDWPIPFQPERDWLRRWVVERPTYAVVNTSPLLALGGSRILWDLPDGGWGGVTLAAALLYAGLALASYRRNVLRYASAHGIAAAVLAALGVVALVDGAYALVVLAVEGLAVHAVARRFEDRTLRFSAHVLCGIVVAGSAVLLSEARPSGRTPLGSPQALSLLVGIGAVVASAKTLSGRALRTIYQSGGHVLALAWLWSELVPLGNGQAYVSVAWGAYAVTLLGAGLRLGRRRMKLAGLATVFLVVGKLFLVDLDALPALWRVLLFIGFGGALLLASYALPGLLRTEERSAE
jgi:uncharacterized membrane protein